MTARSSRPAPRPRAHSGADTPAGIRDQETLERLRGELWLIHYVLQIERERVAHLADQWGHRTFAAFLRERKAQEELPFSLPD